MRKKVMNTKNVPKYLWKIVAKKAWEKSLLANNLVKDPMDSAFVHLSMSRQVSHVVNKFWVGKDYLILKVDTSKLIGEIIYEYNSSKTDKYYHLYNGAIPLVAVVEAKLITAVPPD